MRVWAPKCLPVYVYVVTFTRGGYGGKGLAYPKMSVSIHSLSGLNLISSQLCYILKGHLLCCLIDVLSTLYLLPVFCSVSYVRRKWIHSIHTAIRVVWSSWLMTADELEPVMTVVMTHIRTTWCTYYPNPNVKPLTTAEADRYTKRLVSHVIQSRLNSATAPAAVIGILLRMHDCGAFELLFFRQTGVIRARLLTFLLSHWNCSSPYSRPTRVSVSWCRRTVVDAAAAAAAVAGRWPCCRSLPMNRHHRLFPFSAPLHCRRHCCCCNCSTRRVKHRIGADRRWIRI